MYIYIPIYSLCFVLTVISQMLEEIPSLYIVNFFSVVFHKPNFYKYVFTIIKVIYIPYKYILSSQKNAKKIKLPNPYPTEIFVTSWCIFFHKYTHLYMIMHMEANIYKYSF